MANDLSRTFLLFDDHQPKLQSNSRIEYHDLQVQTEVSRVSVDRTSAFVQAKDQNEAKFLHEAKLLHCTLEGAFLRRVIL